MDAEDLLMREFLGVRDEAQTAATGRWIRSQQREDGTWANFFGGPADLSTTVEAYVALRLAGDPIDSPHMLSASDWILAHGGVEATRVFTRIWLALSGQWSWDDLPVIPPELIYLPAWFPLNIYDWGCWARQTIVAMAIVQSFRPSRPLPFSIDELRSGHDPAEQDADAWSRAFGKIDGLLHRYDGALRAPGRRTGRTRAALRRAALRRCAEWIIARQERDGCWGGIQPPWVYSLMALNLLGYDLDHPVMARGLAGLERFTITQDAPAGPIRRLEACQSPVWGTVLTMIALANAGLPPDHPALVSSARWVLSEEISGPGDWQVRRPRPRPRRLGVRVRQRQLSRHRRHGRGIARPEAAKLPGMNVADEIVAPEASNGAKAMIGGKGVRGVRGVKMPLATRPFDVQGSRVVPALHPAIARGMRWLAGMQCKDGGWGAFDADNTRELINKLPFCDFGAVIDPPTADVTAHIVEAFAAYGLAESAPARRGVVWLLKAQEADGSWFGRWGANYVYGTGAVVPALIAAGVKPSKPSIVRAVEWLEKHQNADGGWGEDLRSYDDPGWRGWASRPPRRPPGPCWPCLPRAAEDSSAVERGIRWLALTQRMDGSWDEPQFTGTGFPGDFYINYHLYRLAFPVSALGRYVHGTGPHGQPGPGAPPHGGTG